MRHRTKTTVSRTTRCMLSDGVHRGVDVALNLLLAHPVVAYLGANRGEVLVELAEPLRLLPGDSNRPHTQLPLLQAQLEHRLIADAQGPSHVRRYRHLPAAKRSHNVRHTFTSFSLQLLFDKL